MVAVGDDIALVDAVLANWPANKRIDEVEL